MDITVIIVCLIVALGGFTQGLTGFGLALVSVPLLSMTVDAKLAVPIAGVFGWLVTFPIVWKMRHSIQYKAGITLVIGSIPASFAGAKLLASLPSHYILLAMGVVLIASSIHSMRSSKAVFKQTRLPVTLGAGFTSGILGASVGEAGPPVIAYTSFQPWTSDQIKSTLAFFFMLQMIGALIGFWSEGLITPEVQTFIKFALPTFIAGTAGGMICYGLLQKYQIDYHRIVHGLLLVIGFVLIYKSIKQI